MAAATNLAPTTTTPASGSDIVVAAGARVTVGLYVAAGSIPSQARATVAIKTPGANLPVASLGETQNTTVLDGPGTFVVTLDTVSGGSTAVGVFTDAG
jgi:TPP-dependent indolepyruvate ferredoxin oxidoreductase alpha subunit